MKKKTKTNNNNIDKTVEKTVQKLNHIDQIILNTMRCLPTEHAVMFSYT